MRYLKVAAASLNQIPLDWEHNCQNILEAIGKAKEAKVTVLCCPELCVTGYGCEDMFLSVTTSEMALKVLKKIASATVGMIVAVGLPILHREGLYNTACLLADGKIIGFVAKQRLAGSGVYYEPRWFKPWPANEQDEIFIDGEAYPFGDIVFDLSGLRLGFEICEDAWAAQRTGIRLFQRGVDLILNPSASHFAFGKSEIRKRLVQEGARAFGVGYIYANLLGNEAGRLIYDGDTLIAEGEGQLVLGPRFSFQNVVVTTRVLDIQNLRMDRTARSNYAEVSEKNEGIVSLIFEHFVENEKKEETVAIETWERSVHLKEEEFTRAVALGLWDYLRKTRSHGFVLNLSGGADSSACATLIYLMVNLAITELGFEHFQKKLSYIFNNETINLEKNNEADLKKPYLKTLLFCLYQKTKNSSQSTWDSALSLTEGLGFPLFTFSIDPIVDAYTQLMQPVFERSLTWEEDDITLQNIQVRARGPSAWMVANVQNCILLSTSNRSEASVGYMTMDGDTCGGLSPLAGIDKHFILQWLQWLEKEGTVGIGAIAALKKVNALIPSAELRPPFKQQRDEDDLMPYSILDKIERLFVHDKYSPTEILFMLQKQSSTQDLRTLANAIELFFIKWSSSQWKRERLAPTFHLDDENVDPKTWCRFPILSGGFKKELAAMWAYVNKMELNNS